MKNIESSDNNQKKSIRKGLGEIKTPLKLKMHSRPNARNAEYLNLYLLNKEKDRNQQEMRAISKRQNQLEDNMEIVQEHTEELIKKITSENGEKIIDEKTSSPKKWQSVKIDY